MKVISSRERKVTGDCNIRKKKKTGGVVRDSEEKEPRSMPEHRHSFISEETIDLKTLGRKRKGSRASMKNLSVRHSNLFKSSRSLSYVKGN